MAINANISYISKLQKVDHASFLNSSIIYPAFLWALQLIIAILTKFIFTSILAPGPYPADGFHSCDGNWYLGIAEHGYNPFNSVVFFPVYPLMIRLVGTLTHLSLADSGFLISNFFFLIALIFFYKIVLKKFERTTAQRALWLLIAFPTSFFFNAVYTESLSFLTIIVFFYLLEQDKWYPAILVGTCAAVVHDLNFLVGFIALIYLFRIRKTLSSSEFRLRFLSLAILPCGVFAYLAFIYHKYHVLFPFAQIQANNWGRFFVVPYTNIFTTFKDFITSSKQLVKTLGLEHSFIALLNGLAVIIISTLIISMISQYRNNKSFTFELIFFQQLLYFYVFAREEGLVWKVTGVLC